MHKQTQAPSIHTNAFSLDNAYLRFDKFNVRLSSNKTPENADENGDCFISFENAPVLINVTKEIKSL